MKNKYFREITSQHKNTFRALHDIFGFNFEKPFTLIKHSGSITTNKAIKELETVKGATEKNGKVILLTTLPKGYKAGTISAAEIKADGKINIDFRAPYGYGWRTTFDWYINKGSFEEARKDTAGTTYILSQAAEFLSPAKPKINIEEGERYKVIEVRKCGTLNSKKTWISNIELKRTSDHGSKEMLEITGKYITRETWKPATLEQVIDKSGYIVYKKRTRMAATAAKIRAERKKAAYMEQDNSGKIEELEKLFAETKERAIIAVNAARTSEEIDKAAKLFTDYKNGLRWVMFSFELYKERTAGKKYSSIEASNDAYNKIMDALKANQEASKEATTANA